MLRPSPAQLAGLVAVVFLVGREVTRTLEEHSQSLRILPTATSEPTPRPPAVRQVASGLSAEKAVDTDEWGDVYRGLLEAGEKGSHRTMRTDVTNPERLREVVRDIHRELRRLSTRAEEIASKVLQPAKRVEHVRGITVRLNLTAAQFQADKQKARKMKQEVQPPLTEQMEAKLPLCTKYEQLLDGGVVRNLTHGGPRLPKETLRYYPKPECRLTPHTVEETTRCLLRKKVVLIGDSTLGELGVTLKHQLGFRKHIFDEKNTDTHANLFSQWSEYSLANGTTVLQVFWVKKSNFPLPSPGLDVRGIHEALREADFVFLAHGLHDQGQACHSLQGYFDGLQRRVRELRGVMNRKAQLYWVETKPIPHIKSLNSPGMSSNILLGYLFNQPQVWRAYREAAAVVMACERVPVLPTFDAYKGLWDETYDSVHYSTAGVNLMIRFITNLACVLEPPKALPGCAADALDKQRQKINESPPEVKYCIDQGATMPLIEKYHLSSDAELQKMVDKEKLLA